MDNKMFCFQCQETAGCSGCTQYGVCGKSPELAKMQDLLVYVTKGISEVTTRLRTEGQTIAPEVNNYITINLFMTTDYLNNNISKLYKLTHSEIYNYGSNGTYQKDLIILGNNIINRNTKNTSSYCLTKEMFSDTLNICSKSKMHTIYPNKIINNNI